MMLVLQSFFYFTLHRYTLFCSVHVSVFPECPMQILDAASLSSYAQLRHTNRPVKCKTQCVCIVSVWNKSTSRFPYPCLVHVYSPCRHGAWTISPSFF